MAGKAAGTRSLPALATFPRLIGNNPMAGVYDARYGVRFPDMTGVYSPRLRQIADEAGREIHLVLPHGVYVALLGPSYETPAEIRALRALGVDAVGMSTARELDAAAALGLECAAISCITNKAAGLCAGPIHHEEVLAAAATQRDRLAGVIEGFLQAAG